MIIAKIDDLEIRATEIYAYVSQTIPDDWSLLPTIGSDLAQFNAESGKMLADAKYYLNCATKTSIMKYKSEMLSPTIMKELINSDCTRENYLVDLIERINRTTYHQLEWVRTLISKGKEEMRVSNMFQK